MSSLNPTLINKKVATNSGVSIHYFITKLLDSIIEITCIPITIILLEGTLIKLIETLILLKPRQLLP